MVHSVLRNSCFRTYPRKVFEFGLHITSTTATVLNSTYRNARDADVRERILLITRVRLDKNEASSVAEKEFPRSTFLPSFLP